MARRPARSPTEQRQHAATTAEGALCRRCQAAAREARGRRGRTPPHREAPAAGEQVRPLRPARALSAGRARTGVGPCHPQPRAGCDRYRERPAECPVPIIRPARRPSAMRHFVVVVSMLRSPRLDCADNCIYKQVSAQAIAITPLHGRALRYNPRVRAGIAQLVEQLICNQKVVGSIPIAGTRYSCKSCAAQKFLAFSPLSVYSSVSPTRGGAVWQLVGLITRRSQVQILPPQPNKRESPSNRMLGLSRFCVSLWLPRFVRSFGSVPIVCACRPKGRSGSRAVVRERLPAPASVHFTSNSTTICPDCTLSP